MLRLQDFKSQRSHRMASPISFAKLTIFSCSVGHIDQLCFGYMVCAYMYRHYRLTYDQVSPRDLLGVDDERQTALGRWHDQAHLRPLSSAIDVDSIPLLVGP